MVHPYHALKSDIHFQTLLHHNPEALMRASGVWADTATGIQNVENWLNEHPALLTLLKNTGNLVGGAMWLKNLTPVGLLTGLVVNYGYEQHLKLMECNLELTKEHLTTYLQKHDEDITSEQAQYLANISVKVLETAGQIAIHQIAAKGFNKGFRVMSKEVSPAKVHTEDKYKFIDVLKGTNTPTVINKRKYTGHALDRMKGKGFTPTVVENTIKYPIKTLPGKTAGTIQYIGEALKVVLNNAGNVITVIPQ